MEFDLKKENKNNKIIVVGIGPGSPDYIPPIAARVINGAKVLVGSRRALDAFALGDGLITKKIDRDIEGVLDFIAGRLETNEVVVMVSGDPGFYSLLAAIRNRFSNDQIEVIPGISSIQTAFAKANEVWQDADLISMHGRGGGLGLSYQSGKKLGILTDGEYNAGRISKMLIDAGWPRAAKVWLCSNLSYDNEQVLTTVLEDVAKIKDGFEHCVMVVKA